MPPITFIWITRVKHALIPFDIVTGLPVSLPLLFTIHLFFGLRFLHFSSRRLYPSRPRTPADSENPWSVFSIQFTETDGCFIDEQCSGSSCLNGPLLSCQ